MYRLKVNNLNLFFLNILLHYFIKIYLKKFNLIKLFEYYKIYSNIVEIFVHFITHSSQL